MKNRVWIVIGFLLLPGYARSQLPWSASEIDRAKNHVLIVDLGAEVRQGIRLEKTVRHGREAYFASVVVDRAALRTMPITKKIFYERYLSFRNQFISPKAKTLPSNVCRLTLRVTKRTDRAPASHDSLCLEAMPKTEKAKLNAWYRSTLSMIQHSSY